MSAGWGFVPPTGWPGEGDLVQGVEAALLQVSQWQCRKAAGKAYLSLARAAKPCYWR